MPRLHWMNPRAGSSNLGPPRISKGKAAQTAQGGRDTGKVKGAHRQCVATRGSLWGFGSLKPASAVTKGLLLVWVFFFFFHGPKGGFPRPSEHSFGSPCFCNQPSAAASRVTSRCPRNIAPQFERGLVLPSEAGLGQAEPRSLFFQPGLSG